MEKVDKEEQVVLSVVLLLITVLCLGFSFWSMMEGYESLVGNIFASAAMSFAIALMLFALNYRLRRALMQGVSGAKILGIFMLYLVVVVVSFSGLFNKFYSTFMHTELITEELADKISLMTKLKHKAIASLSNQDAEILQDKVKAKVNQLRDQIMNPGNQGMGNLANEVLVEIEGLLGSKITRLQASGSTGKALQELAERYEKMILGENGMLVNSENLSKLNSGEKRAYLNEIPKLIDPKIELLSQKGTLLGNSSDSVLRSDAIAALREAVQVTNTVCQKTKSLQKNSKFECDDQVRVKNEQIGKIHHTYQSASQHLSNPGVWIAIFIALAIDLIVPVFVFFMTPRGYQPSSSKRGNTGPQTLKNEF